MGNEHCRSRLDRPDGAALEKSILRRISLLILAFTLWQACSAAAADPATEIRHVIHAQQEAWNSGDIDKFMDGYARSRSTGFVSEDSITRGWQTVRDRYKKKYSDREKMGTLTFSDLEITSLGPSAAIAIGRWQLKRKGDKPHGRFTLVFRHLPEGWRIVHDHTSAAR
jgi:ketosteroid isomerase-like protein